MVRLPRCLTYRRTVTCLLGLALFGAAACGTRVPIDEIAEAEGGPFVETGGEATRPGPAAGADVSVPGAAGAPGTEGATTAGGPASAAPTGAQSTAPAIGGGNQGPASTDCTAPGPPILIGSVGSFSGLLGPILGPGRQALEMWVQYVNSQGGVGCHPVELVVRDDQSDPARSQAVAQELINQGVVAFVGSFVPISIAGYQSGIAGSGVPTVGGDGSTPNWNEDPLLYNVGSDVDTLLYIGMHSAAAEGLTRGGFLFCVEASTCSNADAKIKGGLAQAAGVEIVYRGSISLTQTDFTAQCQSAKNKGATQFFLGMDGASITRLARGCLSIGYTPRLITNAIAASFDTEDPNIQRFDVTVGSSVFPFSLRSGAPGIDRWADALDQFGGSIVVNGAAAQAFAFGEMFRRAIEALGPEAQTQNITSAMVLQGLGAIDNETLGGLIPPTTFSPNQPASPLTTCGFVMMYTGGQWTAPRGLEQVCRP